MLVVRVRQTDSCRLNQKPDLLRINRLDARSWGDGFAKKEGCFVTRQDRLIRGAIQKTDSTLEARPDPGHRFQQDRIRKMAREVDPLTDRELTLRNRSSHDSLGHPSTGDAA